MHSDLGSLRVRAFWLRRRKRGFMVDAAPGTTKSYLDTLQKWEAGTDDPPIAKIVKDTIDAWRAWMLAPAEAGPEEDPGDCQAWLFADLRPPRPVPHGLSRASANKHLRQMHHVLIEAVNLEILDRVPKFDYLKIRRRRPRSLTAEHLDAIYRACAVAIYPRVPGVSPDRWWQAFLTTACTVGFRRQGLWGLRWEGVDFRAGLIRLDAEEDKCDEERVKPMSRLLVHHLLRIRTDRELVFPWPHSESTFYRQWRRIQEAAGLTKPAWYKVHDLKRTCGTLHSRQGASPWAVKELLDHATLKTSEYYVDASDEAREAVDRLRLPAAFYADFPTAGELPSAAG